MLNPERSEIEIYRKLSKGEITKEEAVGMLAAALGSGRDSSPSRQVQPERRTAAPSIPATADILSGITTLIAESLHLPPEELRHDVSFQELGIDSINGLEITQALNRTFGISLDAVVLYDYATLNRLSRFVEEELERNRGLYSGVRERPEEAAQPGNRPQTALHGLEELADSPTKSKLKLAPLGVRAGNSGPVAVPHRSGTQLPQKGAGTESAVAVIVGLISDNLHMPPEELHLHAAFSDLGVDSINGLEIIRDVNRVFGLQLDAVALYDYGTIAGLAAHVQEEQCKRDNALAAARPAAEPEDAVGQAEASSEVPCGIPSEAPYGMPSQAPFEAPSGILPGSLAGDLIGSFAGEEDIAVIGMSGRFPGAVNTAAFWDNLIAGVDSVSEIPRERWDGDRYFDPSPSAPNKSYSRVGGFLDGADRFDTLFFNIPPVEALSMDPQQRLFLEEAWKALEDAGCSDAALSDSRCGVFVGAAQGDYMKKLDAGGQDVTGEAFMGMAPSMFAARIAYFLNLTGPSLTIDTACSSSLVALHLACQSIRGRESEMAIVGGVRLNLTPDLHIMTSKVEMLSPAGKCRAFDQSADGTILSEGVGAIVLKPLRRAIADKHSIYAVIKGSGVNQDGKTNGITAPSSQSQFRLEADVYRKAGINPDRISYIEAHGTGTKLGDPIEVKALTRAFREHTDRKQYCAIGSVKTNIGHTTSASGIIGTIKVLLAMKHRRIPATLHYEQPNEHIPFPDTPFYVNAEPMDWNPQQGQTRLAAVSSFGFSGTNAHAVLEDYPVKQPHSPEHPFYLITFSAKSEDALRARLADMRVWLERQGEGCSIADIAYTLNVGRSHFPLRAALVVSGLTDLRDRLQEIALDGDTRDYMSNLGHARKTEIPDPGVQPSIRKAVEDLRRGSAAGAQVYKGRLLALADFYVKGFVSRCEDMFTEENLSLLHLPGYPFMGDRYWIGDDSGAGAGHAKETGAGLHPMLDRNVSTLNEQRYEKMFTGQEFYLADHRVGSDMILPAVGYLEMAKAAGDLAHTHKRVVRLTDNYWSNAIKTAGEPKTVSLSLIPLEGEPDTVAYEVWSMEAQERVVVHGTGKIHYEEPEEQRGDPVRVGLERIRQRCTRTITGEQCYRMFDTAGLNLGRSFQAVQELMFSEEEVLARLRLPAHLVESAPSYTLHPALMDGALEAVIGMLSMKVKGGGVRLPYYIGSVEVAGELTEDGFAYAQCTGTRKVGLQETECFDVFLLDGNGRVLVKITDFSLWEIGGSEERTNRVPAEQSAADSVMYFRPDWKREGWTDAGAEYGHLGQGLLVFDTGSALREALESKLGPSKAVLVKPGETYRQEEGGRSFVIRPGESGDYDRLFEALKLRGGIPSHIAYLWSADSEFDPDTPFEAYLEESLYSVVRLVQSLERAGQPGPLRLSYVFRADRSSCSPFSAAFGGFARSLRLENAGHLFKTVRMDAALPWDEMAEGLLAEFHPAHDQSAEVAYAEGSRWVKALAGFEAPEPPSMQTAGDGVYLITGGTGGLGLLFARYFATGHKAKLCLSGRSPLTEEQRARIGELEELGSEVAFIQADISDAIQAERLIREAKERFGKLNGIIHAAGVNSDAYLRDQTRESMERVLAPKMAGTLHLDRLTRHDDLEFFAMFSSTSAVTGNLGQTGYAYANSFMDHFAELRHGLTESGLRSGRTLSINWPLWNEGGMQVSDETKALFKGLGISGLETANGIQALLDGLASKERQLVVFQGQSHKLRPLLGLDPAENTGSAGEGSEGKADFTDRIRESLVEAVGSILRIKEKDIHADKMMDEYGFNSLTFTELANRINLIYGTNVNPSLFFEHPTLRSLIDHLHEQHYDNVRHVYRPKAGYSGLTEASGVPPAIIFGSLRGTGGMPGRPARHPESDTGERRDMRLPDETGALKAAPDREDIAVIGMSGILPRSEDLAAFWKSLKDVRDLVTEVPPERWNREELSPDVSRWGGFMEKIDCFDPLFFGISPMEAELMDPQQRIYLQTVWDTIADAGYKPSDLSGTSTGLFVGVSTTDYRDVLKDTEIEALTSTGNSHCILANRISYLLDIHGPSEPIDTACSSSLVAIHRGVESIRSGDCEMAIVGGVNVIASPTLHISFSKAGMLSPDGRCKTFDETANGYVRGEGSGALFLKPLGKALEAGDHVYAVIKGTAINHGGHAASLTAPNPNAQADLIVKAMGKAGVDPATVSYIEAHGTGTKLGDPVEMNGLMKAFRELGSQKGSLPAQTAYCGIGSVKANIGHLETAAGIAGVLKVLLAMKHRTLPGTPHLKVQNPFIQLSESPFYIVKHTQEWKAPLDKEGVAAPLRAGISSFGFGGVNAHVVLEEYRSGAREEAADNGEPEPRLIVLSARNKERLKAYAERWAAFLEKEGEAASGQSPGLTDIAYTLQVGRQEMDERVAFLVRDHGELAARLHNYVCGRNDPDYTYEGRAKAHRERGDYPGSGSPEAEMIRDLIRSRDLGRLAGLWVTGAQIDWQALYAEPRPKRVSLPAYPFEQRRIWMGKKSRTGDAEQVVQAVQAAQPVPDISASPEEASSIADHFFKSTWAPLPSESRKPAAASAEAAGKQVLVVIPEEYAEVAHEIAAYHCKDNVALVLVGSRNNEQAAGQWEIDIRDKEALPAVLQKTGALDTVYFLGGLTSAATDCTDPASVELTQEQGVVTLFRLIRAMAEYGFDNRKIAFKVWTNNVHAVNEGECVMPCAGSVLGMAKTMAKEFTRWETSCTDVDLAELERDPALLALLMSEPPSPKGDEIVIRQGIRYARRITPVRVPAHNDIPFRKGGTYLIIGGAGGIGLELGRYLSRTVQANIALIGRSAENAAVRDKLRDVEAAGGQAIYVQADAGDPEAMKEAVKQIKARFGSLNGAVHSAIVMKDRSLRNMTESELKDALAPKVQGSVAAYSALKDEKLDFMMFFSSIQTFVGNPGQGNYAAACAFKDAFAAYLDSLGTFPVKLINWGYWGTVGVASSKEHNRRSAAAGLHSISPAEGMEAVRCIAAVSGWSHSIVLKAEEATLREAGIETEEEAIPLPRKKSAPQPAVLEAAAAPVPAEELRRRVEEQVASSLAEVLKVGSDEVDYDVPFSDYGVDSITGLALIRHMGEAFDLELKSTLLFDYSNIRDFSAYLCGEHGPKIAKVLPGGGITEAADATPGAESEIGMLERLAQGELSVEEALQLIG